MPGPTEPVPRDAPFRVGVAGWDYPDWRGRVYPDPAPVRFDRLAWVARFVDVVEINATFYRPAAPATARGWVRRTAPFPRFRFAAKAHRTWTHEPGADLDAVVGPTLAGLAPLRDAGRLASVLVQFPQRLHRTEDAYRKLDAIASRTRGWPVTVEVRHRSWSEPGAADRLRDLGLGWCVVDQPLVGGASEPVVVATTPLAYLRLHGRNRRDWFREDAGRDERYDYRYDDRELDGLADTARRLAEVAESVVVVQNNHFRGQAMANALQMRRRLEGARPPAPEPLVATFPDLARDCAPDQTRLF